VPGSSSTVGGMTSTGRTTATASTPRNSSPPNRTPVNSAWVELGVSASSRRTARTEKMNTRSRSPSPSTSARVSRSGDTRPGPVTSSKRMRYWSVASTAASKSGVVRTATASMFSAIRFTWLPASPGLMSMLATRAAKTGHVRADEVAARHPAGQEDPESDIPGNRHRRCIGADRRACAWRRCVGQGGKGCRTSQGLRGGPTSICALRWFANPGTSAPIRWEGISHPGTGRRRTTI
jgi:hypothetical protein